MSSEPHVPHRSKGPQGPRVCRPKGPNGPRAPKVPSPRSLQDTSVKNDLQWRHLAETELVESGRGIFFGSGSVRPYWLDAVGTRVHVFGYGVFLLLILFHHLSP